MLAKLGKLDFLVEAIPGVVKKMLDLKDKIKKPGADQEAPSDA